MSKPTEEEVLRDLRSRHWTCLGEAPTAMLLGSAVVAWDESRAIITGGLNDTRQATGSITVYNKDTMETAALPSMLQARMDHAAAIVGGNLFVIGGSGDDLILLNSIEVLDLNDPREWKRYPVTLRAARYGCSAVAIDEHQICIIGGIGRSDRNIDSVEILNISTETIAQGPSMLEPRCPSSAALVGDSIVVAGGWGVRSACEKLSRRVGSDEEARRWQPLHSNMTTERANHKVLCFENCMVLVGGHASNTRGDETTNVWNSFSGSWTQLPARLPAVGGFTDGFVRLGNDLVYFVGGDHPSVYCLFSSKGLLEHQRRQIRFKELIADERVEIVIPLLLEELGQRGWVSLFYECIRETNGRLIPRRRRSVLGKRHCTGRMK